MGGVQTKTRDKPKTPPPTGSVSALSRAAKDKGLLLLLLSQNIRGEGSLLFAYTERSYSCGNGKSSLYVSLRSLLVYLTIPSRQDVANQQGTNGIWLNLTKPDSQV